MSTCERCYSEYLAQSESENAKTYREILAQNTGVCSPADMCGTRHTVPHGANRCACGEFARATA